MDNRDEVRDFLSSRRDRITPEKAGLPVYGTTRRVKGLRREEVAMLAGVSVDYYTRLERGNLAGASESVLDAVCRALQLDEAERGHLLDLARASGPVRERRAARQHVRPSVQWLLDAMTGVPAYVRNGRMDVVAANAAGRVVFAEVLGDRELPVNMARYLFLNPRAAEFYVEWEDVARGCVGVLRTEAGRNPYDRALTDLVGELSTRSEEFRSWWASHDVNLHRSAQKRLLHPVVGEVQVTGEAFELPADPGLTMISYAAEPGTASHEALAFLASWAGDGAPAAVAEVPPEG